MRLGRADSRPMTTPRDASLRTWVRAQAGLGGRIEPLTGDASFRRYLRLRVGRETFVVMDAPPEKEDSAPFVHVANLLRAAGVNVPEVHAADLERGFLLLDDLGSVSYLDRLEADRASALYQDAFTALIRMQCNVPADAVPPYDEARLTAELELFPEWFLGRHLGRPPSRAERGVLDEAFAALVEAALAQPRVFVHRDYHSRNLMVHDRNPGILDFQDAVAGPLAYDAVSLLRDAYIAWPEARVSEWLDEYAAAATQAGLLPADRPADVVRARLRRDFDLIGVQRHLKVAGIFTRLWHRDGKDAYLGDLPLVLRYLLDAVTGYPELDPLARLFERRGLPRLARAAPCGR